MGRSKALLPVPPDNIPLIQHIMWRLQPLWTENVFERRIVITNDPEIQSNAGLPDDVYYYRDLHPDAGALGGIATALAHCDGWVLMAACDMPLLNSTLLTHLCKLAISERACDVIVPVVNGYEQTMHALYHRRCLPAIEARLAKNQRRIVDFFADVNVYRIPEDKIRPYDPAFHSFMNVNTPSEWQIALKILRNIV